MVHGIGDRIPAVKKATFLAWNAEVAGDVTLEEETSVWFSATLRADLAPITLGRGTNVQDSATLHVDTDLPLRVGRGVTIGHNAVLHGCTVGDDCLIGMAAVVLSGAVIGKESVVGAGALVTEEKSSPRARSSSAARQRPCGRWTTRSWRRSGRTAAPISGSAGRRKEYREAPGGRA